jgi:hypothetical protein
MYKKNSVWVGLLGGLALPSLAFLLVDFIKSNLSPYVRVDLLYIGCVALNLILVNLAYKYHKEETAKGVISATFICAFIFFYYKYTS